MALAYFLLLLLALAFVPSAYSDLLAPRNVRTDSYNLQHILRWDAVERQHKTLPVTYNVEFQTYDHVQELCANITQTLCNFTGKIHNFHRGRLKVQAQQGAQRSDWTITQEFQGNKNTIIGPVKSLSLHPEVGGMIVNFSPPFPSIPSDWKMDYVLFYWKKDSPEEELVNLYSSTTYKLKNLAPWTLYCVRVNVSTVVIDGQPSDPVCAATLGTDWTISAVLVVLLVFVVIAMILYILPKHSAKIKNFLQGSHSIPLHYQEYLEDPPAMNCVANTQLTCEEERDHVSIVESVPCYAGEEETSSSDSYQGADKT